MAFPLPIIVGFGGPKVADGFWIKGQEAIPRMMVDLARLERQMDRHEHAQYGKNRRTRRANPQYRLYVKGLLS